MQIESKDCTTYRTSDGLTINFLPPKPGAGCWEHFAQPGTFSYPQSQQAVARMLTRDFIDDTLSRMRTTLPDTYPDLAISLVQQGVKFAVYKVSLQDPAFILITSRGTTALNAEVKTDYYNLLLLRQELVRRHWPVFIPQPLHCSPAGFSVEYLHNHLELTALPDRKLQEQGTHQTYFLINDSSDKAVAYNALQHQAQRTYRQDYLRGNYHIKVGIVARLWLAYLITGCLPAEFAVNAGDFMINPSKPALNLMLTTVRGGWRKLDRESQFFTCLLAHVESIRYQAPDGLHRITFPFFDADENLIYAGVSEANNLTKIRPLD